jgi:hypothetical protein
MLAITTLLYENYQGQGNKLKPEPPVLASAMPLPSLSYALRERYQYVLMGVWQIVQIGVPHQIIGWFQFRFRVCGPSPFSHNMPPWCLKKVPGALSGWSFSSDTKTHLFANFLWIESEPLWTFVECVCTTHPSPPFFFMPCNECIYCLSQFLH